MPITQYANAITDTQLQNLKSVHLASGAFKCVCALLISIPFFVPYIGFFQDASFSDIDFAFMSVITLILLASSLHMHTALTVHQGDRRKIHFLIVTALVESWLVFPLGAIVHHQSINGIYNAYKRRHALAAKTM